MSRESVVGLVVLGVLLVLVVSAAVVGVVARRRRGAAQDELLRDLGWEAVPVDHALLDRWKGAPFDVQDRGRVEDLRTGTVGGRPLVTFRYAWRSAATMAGRGRPTMVECQVVALDASQEVPTVEVVPVGYGQPSVQRVVGRQVVFDDPAFAAAWTVRAPDELAAHEILTASVRQMLLAPAYAGTRLRFESGAVLSWTDGPAPVEDVRDLALLLAGVLAHVRAPGRPEDEETRPAQAPDR
ncbi:hypothetical protein ACFVQ3_05165 [Oerskovia sp. NPDC057915]|uniref:hypothetical protein n=1 Tax=Oerskovia sp. NPDC057915 TaxID=3346280 RepID=UPI0036DC4A4C